MRVLLINPSMPLKNFGKFARLMEPMPPIGLASLAAVLRRSGHQVAAHDDFVHRKGAAGIRRALQRFRPRLVGISCLTPSAPLVLEMARAVKEQAPTVTVVLGNLHASLFAEEILTREEAVDFVVHGEGEEILDELVAALEEGGDPGRIPGLSLRENHGVRHTGKRGPPRDLDALPHPAWDLFPYRRYSLLPFVTFDRPVATISGSRGCPYRCTFCSLVYLTTYRRRRPAGIAEEIAFLMERYRVRQVGFVDPVFPLSREHTLEVCEALISRGLPRRVGWVCETRQDCLDPELLRRMREAGCRRVILGLESGVKEMIDEVDKRFTPDDGARAVRWAREAGIETVGLFMLGLPGENEEMAERTIAYAREIGLDFAKFAIAIPFPGSRLFERMRAEGRLSRTDWENYTTFHTRARDLIPVNRELPAERWMELQKRANREFYLRPGMILRHLFKVRSLRPRHLAYGLRALLA